MRTPAEAPTRPRPAAPTASEAPVAARSREAGPSAASVESRADPPAAVAVEPRLAKAPLVAPGPVEAPVEARPVEPRSARILPAEASPHAPGPEGPPAEAPAEPPPGAPATDADVMTLAQWLSPGFPVGAYAYSHGLEWAIAEGWVSDAATLQGWLADVIAHGSGRSDAIVLAAAHRAASEAQVEAVAETARAVAPSRERLAEAALQGGAFCAALRAVWGLDLADAPYPVALGRACRLRRLPLGLAAAMHLQALAANLVSAAVRAVPLGQTEGQACLAALGPLCREVAAKAVAEDLGALSSTAFLSDVASMRHETQPVRIFRS